MSLSLLRERQAEAGARIGDAGESELILDYGDVDGEYNAIRKAAGIIVRDDRTQLRMRGRDPVRMLNGLITNDLGLLDGGRAVQALMLTPKGRIITDLRVLRWAGGEDGDLLIDIAFDALGPVTGHLRKYVPPLFARWEVVSDKVSVLGIYGPRLPPSQRTPWAGRSTSKRGK